jgi:hypothetical protein
MMNIMVGGVVCEKNLEGIPWESVAAMIVDRLQSSKGEKVKTLSLGQTGNLEGNSSTESVHQKTLNWVIVKSTESIRHIESVMSRMKIA